MFIDTLNPKFRFYFEEPDDGGAGTKKKVTVPTLPPEVLESLKNLEKKSGGSEEASKILYDDNKNLREKIRQMEANQLGDGKVAVAEADAKLIEKIKTLGGIEKVEKIFTDYEDLQKKVDQIEKDKQISQVASIYGWTDEVLKDLLKDSEIEIKKTKDDEGNEVQRAFLKTDDGETEVGSFINDKKSVYLPALQQGNGDTGNTTGGKRKFVSQNKNNQGSKNASQSIVEKRKQKMKERASSGNALNPKTSE